MGLTINCQHSFNSLDSYSFKDEKSYSGEGISLHMIVTRKDLEKFVSDLEKEYNDLPDLQS